jgi:exonuclease III
MNIAKIASININGITAQTWMGMLTDFLRRHDFDIPFIYEVTSPEFPNLKDYVTHLNIGTAMRWTAILARNDFPLTNIVTIPSGRAFAVDFSDINLNNVYAPSGAA